jgi:hypothetical protein
MMAYGPENKFFNNFWLCSCPLANHGGELCTNHPGKSTYLVTAKCLTHLRTYIITTCNLVPTHLSYLATCIGSLRR